MAGTESEPGQLGPGAGCLEVERIEGTLERRSPNSVLMLIGCIMLGTEVQRARTNVGSQGGKEGDRNEGGWS